MGHIVSREVILLDTAEDTPRNVSLESYKRPAGGMRMRFDKFLPMSARSVRAIYRSMSFATICNASFAESLSIAFTLRLAVELEKYRGFSLMKSKGAGTEGN